MEIQIAQSKLSKALNTVSKVAAGSKTTLPVLNNVLIRASDGKVSFTTTNLDMAIVDYLPVKPVEDGVITVPARLLAEFVSNLPKGETIKIFNYGNCKRDFTYVDDIVEGIVRILDKGPKEEYNLYNIGNNHPENLMDFVYTLANSLKDNGLLDKEFNVDEHMELVAMQPGDVETTYADTSKLEEDYGFKPNTSLKDGLNKFAKWYKDYYRL